MKIVAVVVMVLGVTLMSAPLVLPHLGINAIGPAPAAPQGSGLAHLGRALTDGIGSVTSYLGAGEPVGAVRPSPEAGGVVPTEVAAQMKAACAEMARAAQSDPAVCDTATEGVGGVDPAAMAGLANGATAAAIRDEAAGVTQRKATGAKFLKVDKGAP